MESTLINQPVCESRNTDKVVKFLTEKQLSDEMIEAINQGLIWGVYYDENGHLVAEYNDGEIITNNILR